jgi:hypothetical protein
MTNEGDKLKLIGVINGIADRVDDRWLIMTHAQANEVWRMVRELEDKICTRKVDRRGK